VTGGRVSRSETRFRVVSWGFAAGSGRDWDHLEVLLSLVYRFMMGLLDLLVVLFRSDLSKDAELLALRHENQVLRRQLRSRLRWDHADRLWLAALSRLVSRRQWPQVFAGCSQLHTPLPTQPAWRLRAAERHQGEPPRRRGGVGAPPADVDQAGPLLDAGPGDRHDPVRPPHPSSQWAVRPASSWPPPPLPPRTSASGSDARFASSLRELTGSGTSPPRRLADSGVLGEIAACDRRKLDESSVRPGAEQLRGAERGSHQRSRRTGQQCGAVGPRP